MHGREGHEVRVEDLLRFANGNTQALREAKRFHAVGQPVTDHLRFGALFDGDRGGINIEHSRRRCVVNVLARFKRTDQTWIFRQVCDATEFDLVVVGDEERVALRGNKCLAEFAPEFTAHRNVVKVRSVGTETTCSRNRLVESRMNAAIGCNFGKESFAIGGTKLLDLAIGKEVLDDWMLTQQLLERCCIGRVTGLRLLLWRELQFFEKDLAQLHGGVHVELFVGVSPDQRAQFIATRNELVSQLSEFTFIDTNAENFHSGEYSDQRNFNIGIQVGESASNERFLQGTN
ncbi:unannotated protein [freshwater metagenome]|uniref:Unannotated protein n=1 Tax=freshwater metagenome TaxID=449393 RepID=A0A6J6L6C2_9ZZZZ